MAGFTIVDAGVAGIILVSGLLAFARGMMRETMAILGWGAAFVLAYAMAGALKPLAHEFPYVGALIAGSCELALIVAFLVLLALFLVVFSFFTPIVSSALRASVLRPLDQWLGFVFGVLRGVLLVALIFIAHDRVITGPGASVVENSHARGVFAEVQDVIEAAIPDDSLEWTLQKYAGLVASCIPAPAGEGTAGQSGATGT